MAEKRQVKKKKKSKLKSFFVILLVLIILTGVLAVLSCTVLFNAEKITAKGTEQYTSEQIIDAADVSVGDNIVLMSETKISQKVLEKLPLIGEVKLNKNFPSEVEIKVKDANTDMAFITGDKYIFTDDFRAVRFSAKEPKSEMLIVAKIQKPTLGKQLSLSDVDKKTINDVIEICKKNEITEINQIDISVLSEISIICFDNFKIEMGTIDNFDYKLQNAKTIIKSVKSKYGQKVQGVINVENLSEENNTSYFKIDSVQLKKPTQPVVSQLENGQDSSQDIENDLENGEN